MSSNWKNKLTKLDVMSIKLSDAELRSEKLALSAQRLAEALEGYERMSEKFTAISNPSREVVEQLQTALKFIAPATRAALVAFADEQQPEGK